MSLVVNGFFQRSKIAPDTPKCDGLEASTTVEERSDKIEGECSVSMTTQIRKLADRYTAAWNSQDPASVAACYSPNGSLTVNSDPPAVGRDAVTKVAQGFMTAFPDLKIQMDSLEVNGDQFVYHWTLMGTNTGPSGTGNRVHISGFEEWRIGSDGLVGESHGHFDSAEYQRQLEAGGSDF